MRNLIVAGVALGISLALASCGRDLGKVPRVEGEYRGHRAVISIDGAGRRLTLDRGEKNARDAYGGLLTAIDWENDGRFDEVVLVNVPNGDPLEGLADMKTMEEAYQAVKSGYRQFPFFQKFIEK